MAGQEDELTLVLVSVGRHAVVSELFEPEFLKKARQEIVEHISFREKETDICERFARD